MTFLATWIPYERRITQQKQETASLLQWRLSSIPFLIILCRCILPSAEQSISTTYQISQEDSVVQGQAMLYDVTGGSFNKNEWIAMDKPMAIGPKVALVQPARSKLVSMYRHPTIICLVAASVKISAKLGDLLQAGRILLCRNYETADYDF